MKLSTTATTKKYVKQLSGFKGIDFSSSRLDMADTRASYMENIISNNGANIKRNGAEEKYRFVDTNGIGLKINGYWEIKCELYNSSNVFIRYENKTIVHAGKHLFLLQEGKARYTTSDSIYTNANITDEPSYGIFRNNTLYILCGDYIKYYNVSYNNWQIKRVVEDAYIPTTTITNIDGTIINYEETNLLSNKVKNRFYLSFDEGETTKTYYFDRKFYTNFESNILPTGCGYHCAAQAFGNEEELYYTHNGIPTSSQPNSSSGVLYCHISIPNNSITFYNACPNPYYDITFVYTSDNTKNEEKITKCKIGIPFSYNEIESLFLSGNERYPNYDWHSSELRSDLSYFSDLSYTQIGTATSKIMAYSLLEDGILAIHKETSNTEPCIYYRTCEYGVAKNAAGMEVKDSDGNYYYKLHFVLSSGTIGEGVVSYYTNGNLAGDNLILSKNGVFGIVMNTNIKSTERYARERSRLINTRLTSLDLTNAKAIVHDNRYYLSVDNVCFIADARFVHQTGDEMSDTFSYEWYYWTNIPLSIWVEDNAFFGYGTNDGRIMEFKEDLYSNITYESIGLGNIAQEDNTIAFNENTETLLKSLIETRNVNEYIFTSTSGSIEEKLISIDNIVSINEEKLQLEIDPNKLRKLLSASYVKIRYTLKDNNTSTINQDLKYVILETNNYNTIIIKPSEENAEISNFESLIVDLNQFNTFDIYLEVLKGEIHTIDYENKVFTLKDAKVELSDDGEYIETEIARNISGTPIGLTMVAKNIENIRSIYFSPILDLDDRIYSKSINAITITPEYGLTGNIKVGIISRDMPYQSSLEKAFIVGGIKQLDFEEVDFNNFTFEVDNFAKTYTKKVRVKNKSFFQIYVISEDGKKSGINSITILYTKNKLNRGVR